MKLTALGVFFIILYATSSVNALSTDMRATYAQGETFVAEFTGSILEPLTQGQVEFLRGHVSVPLEFDIRRFDDRYFLYAITPFAMNNYTFILHDVVTLVNGQRTTRDFVHNFSTTNETAHLTIHPGFIQTEGDAPLSITLNTDQSETITISGVRNSTRLLRPGVNTIYLAKGEFETGINDLSIGPYRIIVYSTAQNTDVLPRIIGIEPLHLSRVFARGHGEKVFYIILTNTGPTDLTDIAFTYDTERYTLSPHTISRLAANRSQTINLTLLKEDQSFNDAIAFSAGNESYEIPVNITYQDPLPANLNQTNRSLSGNQTAPIYYCRELRGALCSAQQTCSGETLTAADGLCCTGTCIDAQTETSYGWIGYLLGFIVIVIALIIGVRYWKARSRAKSINPLDKQLKRLERSP